MNVSPYLSFNGECETAFNFYEKTLGAKIETMMTWGDSPMAKDISPDWGKKIIHATLMVGSTLLSGGDAPPSRFQKPQGFSVMLNIDSVEETERVFKALSENAQIQLMPLASTFWAERFGMVVDRFGVPWSINCSKK